MESNSEGKNPEIHRQMKLMFEVFADGVLKFVDGKEIKVSRMVLSSKSEVFEKIFKDIIPETTVLIKDYESSDFKLFLDILAGFKDCTAIDALLVFPIAWKYKAENVVRKCLDVLKPTKLDENMCLSLNISLFYKCDELTSAIIDFIAKNKLIFKLLESEKYYSLLEPESMVKLLHKIPGIDSEILKNVFKWGKLYLRLKNKNVEIRKFFEDIGIYYYFDVSCFETILSLLKFNKSELGKGYFTHDEFCNYLEDYELDPRKSEYFKVKAGETITEEFEVRKVAFVTGFDTYLKISRNRVVFYDYPEGETSKMLLWFTTHRLKKAGFNKVYGRWWESLDPNEEFFSTTNFAQIKIINSCNSTVTNLKVKIKFQFLYNARILKTSFRNHLETIALNDADMYFVDSLTINYKEK